MDDSIAVFDGMCRLVEFRHTTRFSRFLNIAQQREAEIAARKYNVAFSFYGGHGDCERKVFGANADTAPANGDFPISCLLVERRGAKFAKPLEHRDVLGSLMGLGVEREVTGDIATVNGDAYVFCLNSMTDYICNSLEKVGSAFVSCKIVPPPELALKNTRETRLQVSSVRLDAVVAHLFKLSRSDAQELFRQRKVALDDVICEKSDCPVSQGQVISVRGYGRAKFIGVEGQSKKGKYNLLIELYT